MHHDDVHGRIDTPRPCFVCFLEYRLDQFIQSEFAFKNLDHFELFILSAAMVESDESSEDAGDKDSYIRRNHKGFVHGFEFQPNDADEEQNGILKDLPRLISHVEIWGQWKYGVRASLVIRVILDI